MSIKSKEEPANFEEISIVTDSVLWEQEQFYYDELDGVLVQFDERQNIWNYE